MAFLKFNLTRMLFNSLIVTLPIQMTLTPIYFLLWLWYLDDYHILTPLTKNIIVVEVDCYRIAKTNVISNNCVLLFENVCKSDQIIHIYMIFRQHDVTPISILITENRFYCRPKLMIFGPTVTSNICSVTLVSFWCIYSLISDTFRNYLVRNAYFWHFQPHDIDTVVFWVQTLYRGHCYCE